MIDIYHRFSRRARALLRGAAQVMFQPAVATGAMFIIGIFWGAYSCDMPPVAWGALVGLVAATVGGRLARFTARDGEDGLWGFNGLLVGCALPTFLPDTWAMWGAIVVLAMASAWLRQGLNRVFTPLGCSSLTFPFVLLSWIALIGFGHVQHIVSSAPAIAAQPLDTSFIALISYWLKGISQVFLIDSSITGLLFLCGLILSSPRAAAWAAIASAISLLSAILVGVDSPAIASGLYGYNPVLTAIALGAVFFPAGWRTSLWALYGIIATLIIQSALAALTSAWTLPLLTAPFCLATWLFTIPTHLKNKRN